MYICSIYFLGQYAMNANYIFVFYPTYMYVGPSSSMLSVTQVQHLIIILGENGTKLLQNLEVLPFRHFRYKSRNRICTWWGWGNKLCRLDNSYHREMISNDLHTGWAKKTAHGFLCNNFAYSQPIFIIFGLYKPQEICNWIVSPPTTIYVTTLPCEILIATLFMFTYIKQSVYYLKSLVVIIVNFCRNFMNIIFKELYLMNNILFVSSV